jgi:tetratricopeptide (TPR) repeat protein
MEESVVGRIIFGMAFLFLVASSGLSFAQDANSQSLLSGMEEHRNGDYAKALESFLQAEKLSPKDADTPFYIGLTYLQLKQEKEAVNYFKKTIKLNPDYLDAHFQLGMVLIQEKNFEEAISHLEKVFRQWPEKENLGYFLGYSHFH